MLQILRASLLCGFIGPFLLGSQPTALEQPSDSGGQSQATSHATANPGNGGQAHLATAPLAPPQPDPLQEAQTLYRQGDLDSALQKYQQVLQIQPKSADAYAGLTRVYLKKKDVQKAFATADRGREMADSPTVRIALAEVFFRQGRIHEAEDVWADMINAGHRDPRAYLGLARVRWAISMNKSAQAMIETAHQMDPGDPEITKLWIERFNRSERIKYLEAYLAGDNNDDAETKARLRRSLEYLKARAQGAAGTCHLANPITTTETPLLRLPDFSHLRAHGLAVDVNGQRAKLLLDTGASGVLISRSVAEKAGVTRLSDLEVTGIGDKGSPSGYMGLAASIKIGDMEFRDCAVQVVDKRSVIGEDGFIGADVFSAFLVDLDFPKETLRLGELPKRPEEQSSARALQTENTTDRKLGGPSNEATTSSSDNHRQEHSGPQDRYIAPEMQSYSKVYRFGHHLLVPTFIEDGAPSRLFLLDTGAFDNVITPEAAAEVTRVRGDHGTSIKGLSGSVKKVYRADKAVLKFGHLQQHNQDLVALDLSHISNENGTEVSGILGFVMLRLLDIKIDYREGLVDFSYDPNQFGR
jgi:pentatricopeptide repeat protein